VRRIFFPERLVCVLTRPGVLLLLIVGVHVVGRVGAVCAPSKFDSFVYAVSAYRFYDPQSSFSDLVPDKPAGQALLTGWCYKVGPGPPTRLTLIPIESAFLLSGYLLFWLLALRLFGRAPAAVLTLLLAVAFNTYNTLDITVAGLNVNENYLLAPGLIAVYAHLLVGRPGWRGFLRGFGVGLSLTIKQTALGLLAVFVIHGLIEAVRHRRHGEGLRSAAWTLVGMVTAWAPLVVVLSSRGWLVGHLRDLAHLSGGHITLMPLSVPPFFKLAPLAAVIWWIIVGMFAWRSGAPDGGRPDDSIGERGACRDRPAVVSFAWLWLVVELAVLWSMTKPSAHYCQQVVAPAVLLAGLGMSGLACAVRTLRWRERLRVWRWAGVLTAVLMLFAVMPLVATISRRVHTFSYETEARVFAEWRATWSVRSLLGPSSE